jgi:hypothetical protein
VRGLNANRNPQPKELFKNTAIDASAKPGPFREYYTRPLEKAGDAVLAPLDAVE